MQPNCCARCAMSRAASATSPAASRRTWRWPESTASGSPFDELSPRELEVALLLVQGLRQDDIAKRLSLSAKTVNTHKARLFEKLDIHDSIALARMASRYGLVDPVQGDLRAAPAVQALLRSPKKLAAPGGQFFCCGSRPARDQAWPSSSLVLGALRLRLFARPTRLRRRVLARRLEQAAGSAAASAATGADARLDDRRQRHPAPVRPAACLPARGAVEQAGRTRHVRDRRRPVRPDASRRSPLRRVPRPPSAAAPLPALLRSVRLRRFPPTEPSVPQATAADHGRRLRRPAPASGLGLRTTSVTAAAGSGRGDDRHRLRWRRLRRDSGDAARATVHGGVGAACDCSGPASVRRQRDCSATASTRLEQRRACARHRRRSRTPAAIAARPARASLRRLGHLAFPSIVVFVVERDVESSCSCVSPAAPSPAPPPRRRRRPPRRPRRRRLPPSPAAFAQRRLALPRWSMTAAASIVTASTASTAASATTGVAATTGAATGATTASFGLGGGDRFGLRLPELAWARCAADAAHFCARSSACAVACGLLLGAWAAAAACCCCWPCCLLRGCFGCLLLLPAACRGCCRCSSRRCSSRRAARRGGRRDDPACRCDRRGAGVAVTALVAATVVLRARGRCRFDRDRLRCRGRSAGCARPRRSNASAPLPRAGAGAGSGGDGLSRAVRASAPAGPA